MRTAGSFITKRKNFQNRKDHMRGRRRFTLYSTVFCQSAGEMHECEENDDKQFLIIHIRVIYNRYAGYTAVKSFSQMAWVCGTFTAYMDGTPLK